MKKRGKLSRISELSLLSNIFAASAAQNGYDRAINGDPIRWGSI
jgi:hypothetical protein